MTVKVFSLFNPFFYVTSSISFVSLTNIDYRSTLHCVLKSNLTRRSPFRFKTAPAHLLTLLPTHIRMPPSRTCPTTKTREYRPVGHKFGLINIQRVTFSRVNCLTKFFTLQNTCRLPQTHYISAHFCSVNRLIYSPALAPYFSEVQFCRFFNRPISSLWSTLCQYVSSPKPLPCLLP